MTSPNTHESHAVLEQVARAAGLEIEGAEPIRLAENDIWRLPGRVVVRIARPGQESAATQEVAVARWLRQCGVAAVRPMDIEQPITADGRAATFWEELPPHRAGGPSNLAPLLRQLHSLPEPPFRLQEMDPFVRIADRIKAARSVNDDDQTWLFRRLDALKEAWQNLPTGLPRCVIHGDAWGGNVAVTNSGDVLLDFERSAYGIPEWDLTSTAVAADTFGKVSETAYADFCEAYGHDVMKWPGYPILRGIRELRLVSFAFQTADQDQSMTDQAFYRLACIQGRYGARPWKWQAVA
ncbi:aminoglycoside phosphotransferase family protein [Streptomyces sp. NPDC090493]|uniref:aminoglycoside phosphotransferase family protein n=1 Tax=Streptomyces sp. NPDC090493 TaxID=3365964 RepID=UPI0037F7D32F